MGHDIDQRDQQDKLSHNGNYDRFCRFPQRIKGHLARHLYAKEEHRAHIDPQRCLRVFHQPGIRCKHRRKSSRQQHDKQPQEHRIAQADFEQKLECRFYSPGISGSVTVTDDRLCSLPKPLKGQHCELHDTCQDRHSSHCNISAVILKRTVKTYGDHTLAGLHDKRSDSKRQTGKYDLGCESEILSLDLQERLFPAQEADHPDAGKRL